MAGCQLALGRRGNTSFGWGGKKGGFPITHHCTRHLGQTREYGLWEGCLRTVLLYFIFLCFNFSYFNAKTDSGSSALLPSTSQYTIPGSCDHQAELLLSGCLAAWVEAVGEGVGGPERQQREPEAVVRQSGGARGPEEAWRMVLRAAS